MSDADPVTRPPIDDQELAAFIDGRLEGERRRRVIERLAEDEEIYELYSTVVAVREAMATKAADGPASEVPPATEGGTPVPFPSISSVSGGTGRLRRTGGFSGWWRSDRSSVGWLPATAAVAAAIAVAVLAVWWTVRPTGSRQLLAAFDAGTVSPEVARAAPDRFEPRYRSGDEVGSARFTLGARAFDLALAVEAGEPESAARWLGEMSDLLEQVPAGFGLPEIYDGLSARLEAGEPLRSLRRDIAEAELEVEALDLPEQPLFAFGRWLEAVRTAAAHGDRRFLASPAAVEPLPVFLVSEPSDDVSAGLEAIRTALGPGAATADLEAVARQAEAILEHCADGRACLGAPDPFAI